MPILTTGGFLLSYELEIRRNRLTRFIATAERAGKPDHPEAAKARQELADLPEIENA